MAYPRQRKEEKTAIDVEKVVAYLAGAFSRATRHLGYNNTKGTELYEYQVEMMWLLHEIMMGPRYITPKFIQEANELIDSIIERAKTEGRDMEDE